MSKLPKIAQNCRRLLLICDTLQFIYDRKCNYDRAESQPCISISGLKDGRCSWPRGKVIGGSSVLNYLVYARGNKRDYDRWAELGNPGWSYDEVLYYFKKSEDNRNPYLAGTRYHGKGGYLTIQEAPWRTPLASAFVEAGVEMGYENRDCNGEFQTGFMIPQATLRRGSRCSTAKAFLRPIRRRPNLHIALHSQVTKVLIDDRSKRAYGVRFRRHNKLWEVRARKEVILSAGAINSPQILLLSGIGPRWHLNEHKIPVVADLSVGENLQDHYGSGAMAFTIDDPVSIRKEQVQNLPSFMRYVLFGKGPLTALAGVEGVAFFNTKYANKSDDYPDAELYLISGTPGSDGGKQIRKVHGLTDDTWQFFQPLANRHSFYIFPWLLRPYSRGSVRLKSNNPFDKPLMYAGYFKDPRDLKTMVEAQKFALSIAQTDAFKRMGAKFWDEYLMPGCEQHDPWTDDYWACCTQHYTTTIYHYSGTCKMGKPDDPGSVVDHELKVYGVRGLRVIDTSIMPHVVSGNTNGPAVMIGERGSDLIKHYWNQGQRRQRSGRKKRSSMSGDERARHDEVLLLDWPDKKVSCGSKQKPDDEK